VTRLWVDGMYVCMKVISHHTTVLPISLNQQNSVLCERLEYVMTILQVIWWESSTGIKGFASNKPFGLPFLTLGASA